MTKEETLQIVNEIITESAECMRKKAEKLCNDNLDFNYFGDRNSFARCIIDVLLEEEREQYRIKNPDSKTRQIINSIKNKL